MVNDNSLSDSVLIQIGALEKDIKDLEDILSHLESSGEYGRGYDRQVANIKNQIQQKTKQIQQFKRSINMNDTMSQLAMIGITQDGYKFEDPKEIEKAIKEVEKSSHPNMQYLMSLKRALELAKQERSVKDAEDPDKKFNAFIQKHGWPTNYEESKALLEKAKKEGIHPDYIHGMERGLKAMTNKDDDATEHGSIETYGKEKETETMPLEKNPVQAQDAYTPGSYDPKRHEVNLMKIDYEISRWRQTVANLKQRIAGLERMNSSGDYGKATARELQEAKREQEAAYMRLQQALSMKQRATGQKDEAPTDVKDSAVNYKGWRIVTEPDHRGSGYRANIIGPNMSRYYDETASYNHELSAVEAAKKLVDFYIKEGVGVKDEVPNHVQDSYEMLKLCGIIS